MYGIVNKAIEDLVVANFGEDKWEAVKLRTNLDIDFFISSEPYDDDLTYSLANAVGEEMDMPVADVLEAFGEWWILKTGKEKYGDLMEAGGEHLKAFLINLPMFHNRIMLIYPKLTPPEFQVTDIEENSISVHYFSKRIGLKSFVRGLLLGLGKMYGTPAQVSLLADRDKGDDHEIFRVSW